MEGILLPFFIIWFTTRKLRLPVSIRHVRRRAEHLYQHLDLLKLLRQRTRRELLAESRRYPITRQLRQIPCIGPIRSALLVALIQTPHRFRSKRQLWNNPAAPYVEATAYTSQKGIPS